MRDVTLCLIVFALVAWMGGCADTDVSCPPAYRFVDDECLPPLEPCDRPVTKKIELGCVVNPSPSGNNVTTPVYWELTVDPDLIQSGEKFGVQVSGTLVFDIYLLSDAFDILNIAFQEVRISTIEARVEVRRGAQELEDEDVVLQGDLPPDGVILIETSQDCANDCADLGLEALCVQVGSCPVKDVRITLEGGYFRYRADKSGTVLFGWAEQGVPVSEAGTDRGAYVHDEMRRRPGNSIQFSGFDVSIILEGGDLPPFAFECIMGVNSRGADGVSTALVGVSPSPDGAFIACPIQEPQ